MRILILSCHSTVNEPIARLTAENKWIYGAHHGYDVLTLRMSWPDAKSNFLDRVLELLSLYDIILTVGSDVLFMNMRVRIESVCGPTDSIVMAKETCGKPEEGWSQINNDVMIWVANDKTRAVLKRLIADRPQWIDTPQLWQRHLQHLILGDSPTQEIKEAVRLVEPRVMNASNLKGIDNSSKWQMGDWIYHAVCGDNEDKHFRLTHYLRMVSN